MFNSQCSISNWNALGGWDECTVTAKVHMRPYVSIYRLLANHNEHNEHYANANA